MGLGPLHTISLTMAREKALECRRLVAAGIAPIVARNGLPSKVEAAYRRGDLLEKRVALMQAWADSYCSAITR